MTRIFHISCSLFIIDIFKTMSVLNTCQNLSLLIYCFYLPWGGDRSGRTEYKYKPLLLAAWCLRALCGVERGAGGGAGSSRARSGVPRSRPRVAVGGPGHAEFS